MATGDLTSLANVRELLQRQSGVDTTNDALISTLITTVSQEIMSYTGCEFAPTTASATRKFVYRGGGTLLLAPYSLRSVTSIVIDTDGTSPADVTLSADDYRLWPREPKRGVYDRIEFRNLSPASKSSAYDFTPSREIEITGAWGFASVPSEIDHACAATVVFRMRTSSDFYGNENSADVQRFGAVQFPTIARQILDVYKVVGVG